MESLFARFCHASCHHGLLEVELDTKVMIGSNCEQCCRFPSDALEGEDGSHEPILRSVAATIDTKLPFIRKNTISIRIFYVGDWSSPSDRAKPMAAVGAFIQIQFHAFPSTLDHENKKPAKSDLKFNPFRSAHKKFAWIWT